MASGIESPVPTEILSNHKGREGTLRKIRENHTMPVSLVAMWVNGFNAPAKFYTQKMRIGEED
jgi:hypothetical protein